MSHGQRLLRRGILLFLFGLVTGLVSQKLTNPRMGLAAHLEGVMNGTFLLAIGAAWGHLRLSPRNERLAFASVLYGTFANWFTTTLAAIFGTAAMTPLASGSFRGQSWQELLVSIGFISVAIAMITASVCLVIGFKPLVRPVRPEEHGNA